MLLNNNQLDATLSSLGNFVYEKKIKMATITILCRKFDVKLQFVLKPAFVTVIYSTITSIEVVRHLV